MKPQLNGKSRFAKHDNGRCALQDAVVGKYDVPIRSLGPDAVETIRTLRLFYEVVKELRDGAKSLREAARRLEQKDLEGRLRWRIPTGKSSVDRGCDRAADFFGLVHFQLGSPAKLFASKGKGWSSELTEVGELAWQLTRDWFICQGLISEND